jgi:toxin secretion/phage lysis holin
MENTLAVAKAISAGILSLILSFLGGYDDLLGFLFLLVISDIVTGLAKAWVTKTLESNKMRLGAVHKAGIILLVIICAYADKFWIEVFGSPIHLGDTDLFIRDWGIIYFCLEELISILENLAVIGVPIPKWLRSILSQVNDTINNSTPEALIKFINEKFNINISPEDKKSDTESEQSSLEQKDETDDSD